MCKQPYKQHQVRSRKETGNLQRPEESLPKCEIPSREKTFGKTAPSSFINTNHFLSGIFYLEYVWPTFNKGSFYQLQFLSLPDISVSEYWQRLRCAPFSGLCCLNTPMWCFRRGAWRCPAHMLPGGQAVWFRPCTCWTVNKRGTGVLILSLRENRHINNHSGRETPTNRQCGEILVSLPQGKALAFSFWRGWCC